MQDVGFATFIDSLSWMYVSEKRDGEDLEVRQRDGGWQVVAGEEQEPFQIYAMYTQLEMLATMVMTDGMVNLVRYGC